MLTPEQVEEWLRAGLPEAEVQVSGDGRHFEARIVSAEFEGLPRIRRHQRVYRVLGDKMQAEIHALSMRTLSPAEAAGESD